jgi:hypothetical protein
MKVPSPTLQAIATRHVYRYEDEFLYTFKRLSTQRSFKTIKKTAEKIWEKYHQGTRTLPTIEFGTGDRSLGRPLSFTLDRRYIELAPKQRDLLTLIHELVHALGADYHDMQFVNLYYKILKEYLPSYIHDAVHLELVVRHRDLLRPYK